jgi:hypothetical protein
MTNNNLLLDVTLLGNLQHIVEAGTGLAKYSYKILITLSNIEDMVPSIPNLCPNLCPIYSDKSSTRYDQLSVTY